VKTNMIGPIFVLFLTALQGGRPGSYQLFAWSRLNGAAYKNAEFMKHYQGRGVPIVVAGNSRNGITQESSIS
jgi:hypothetical protein